MHAIDQPLPDLDRIDLKILRALQADGRLLNLKLAESVTLSPTAVSAREQRVTREGYILGYEARLNPLKLGAGLMVFVEVLLDRRAVHMTDAQAGEVGQDADRVVETKVLVKLQPVRGARHPRLAAPVLPAA